MIIKIRNYIFTGLLVVLPLVVSITITGWLFFKITNGVVRLLPYPLRGNASLVIIVRLVVPIALLVLLALIGMIAKIVFIRELFGIGEKLLIKIPLFNKIYLTVKQISQAFLVPESTMFKRVVLVEFPRPGIYSIGFVTGKSKGEVDTKIKGEVLHIFVPTTPNPTSGYLIFVSPNEVKELDMSIEDGMKLVISGGIVIPKYH